MVRGIDGNGQPFLERRVTLEVSFQGCKFFSILMHEDSFALKNMPSLGVSLRAKATFR